jgi:hypothetical protein
MFVAVRKNKSTALSAEAAAVNHSTFSSIWFSILGSRSAGANDKDCLRESNASMRGRITDFPINNEVTEAP